MAMTRWRTESFAYKTFDQHAMYYHCGIGFYQSFIHHNIHKIAGLFLRENRSFCQSLVRFPACLHESTNIIASPISRVNYFICHWDHSKRVITGRHLWMRALCAKFENARPRIELCGVVCEILRHNAGSFSCLLAHKRLQWIQCNYITGRSVYVSERVRVHDIVTNITCTRTQYYIVSGTAVAAASAAAHRQPEENARCQMYEDTANNGIRLMWYSFTCRWGILNGTTAHPLTWRIGIRPRPHKEAPA